MSWQVPKGTRDLMPDDMALRNELYEKFRKIFELYGYGQVETPAFEDFALLSKKSGEEIKDEIYYFKDKAGRELGLRFDPTVPIARIVATDRSLTKPIKLYYITRMWRYDNPQAGRYREFWQAGCELIGPKGAEADVEVLQIASDLLKAAGVKDFYFKINSRKFIEKILVELKLFGGKISEKTISDICRLLDKNIKIGTDEVAKLLVKQLGMSEIDKNKLMEVLSKSDAKSKEAKDVAEVMVLATSSDVKNIEFDPFLVRGIDYYTGFVFETFVKGKENIGSICSGGRYDSLIKVYGGEDLPAVGFGLGIDRLLDAVGAKAEKPSVKAFVAVVKPGAEKEAADIVRLLRSGGISCETELMGRDLKKQIKYADSKNIPYVVIVGPEEIRKNEVKIKDMKTGKEKNVKIDKLVKEFS